MNSKKSNIINIVWAISLIVIGITTLIFVGSNIVRIELPDIAVRVLGVVDLAALPVLAFSTVKKAKSTK